MLAWGKEPEPVPLARICFPTARQLAPLLLFLFLLLEQFGARLKRVLEPGLRDEKDVLREELLHAPGARAASSAALRPEMGPLASWGWHPLSRGPNHFSPQRVRSLSRKS